MSNPGAAMLPDFRLEVHFSRWEFTARHNLAASDAEPLPMHELLAMADAGDRAAWHDLRLGYTETIGSPALREAIAATYDRVDPADILCFTGAQEGIFCAMHALLEPDDHAVVLVPNYQSMEEIPLAICEVTGVALREREGWALDLDEVQAALRPNTRVIAVNFPNNPTGAMVDEATWTALVELATSRGLTLFSDEVYRGLERDPDAALAQAADLSADAVSLGVVSKAYGLAGLRVGWIACRHRELLARMERVKHYLSICGPAPSELLARIALKARERLLDRNRRLTAANLARLLEFFDRHPALFEWYIPDGGCIMYPRYLGADGVEEFCRSAVEEAGVLLLPASVYRSRLLPVPDDRFRVGFGRTPFTEGLAALERHLTAVRV
jgi:aspartate/methionine/tyrosine aminotransferase